MFAGLFSSNNAKDKASIQTSSQRRLSTTAAAKPPVIPNKPPFPHPLPHTKIWVECTQDGLLLAGLRDKSSIFQSRSLLVSYGKTVAVSTVEVTDELQKPRGAYLCHGCLGILRLFNETYILLLTSRKYVGKYAGMQAKRIFCLTGLAAIPLSSATAAEEAIRALSATRLPARERSRSGDKSSDTGTSSSSESSTTFESDTSQGDVTVNLSDSVGPLHQQLDHDPGKLDEEIVSHTESLPDVSEERGEDTTAGSGKGTDVRGGKSGLGRFLWPARGQSLEEDTCQLVSLVEAAAAPGGAGVAAEAKATVHEASTNKVPATSPKSDDEVESLRALDKKILRELTSELCSGGFYFSQDFDLTTCMQAKWQNLAHEVDTARNATSAHAGHSSRTAENNAHNSPRGTADIRKDEPRISEPLTSRADRRFWYNRWLSKDIVESGAPEFATVLMQGYVQRKRVSLQPVRDGVNAASPTQDLMEVGSPLRVEMLIISRRSVERPGLRYQRRGVNDAGGVANFVETEYIMSTQIEGKDHFTSYVQIRGSIPLYWSQSPWSLKPIPVLEREDAVNQKAISKHLERQVKFYFGAVHIVNLAETSGKEGVLVTAYREAVARLARPEVIYNEWDFHHMCKGMRYERISLLLDQLTPQIDHMASFWLMDGEVLAKQRGVMRVNCMDCLDRTNVVESAFARKHVTSVLEHLGVHNLMSSSQEALDVAFNELWANNGDAISREYAGTSALKGDFVRSGKRNWLGQFNDATNSVARYWQNTVLDFFKQAMIDYILGINTNAFLEFSEKMQTSDPGEITRLANIRQAAVETAASAVLADGEKKLFGWTLISPASFGQIRDTAYEEKILILTAKALYACSFEYTLQKVRDFVRIPLGQIVGIRQGEYILSALDPAARNIEENYGFCLRYLPAGIVERSRTYSIRNTMSKGSAPELLHTAEGTLEIAFKAVRKDFVRDLDHIASPPTPMTSRVQVLDIVDHIRQACEETGATTPEDTTFVEEAPIISLAEAKTQVSLLDRLNYELKNMIWL